MTTPAQNSNTEASWQVTSQTPDSEVLPNNNIVRGYTITFVTGGGHPGQVFVPITNYTVDAVRAAIAPLAALLDQVGNLKG